MHTICRVLSYDSWPDLAGRRHPASVHYFFSKTCIRPLETLVAPGGPVGNEPGAGVKLLPIVMADADGADVVIGDDIASPNGDEDLGYS